MLSSMFTRILDKDRASVPTSYLALVRGLDFLVSWASTVTCGDTVVPSHAGGCLFQKTECPTVPMVGTSEDHTGREPS